MKTADLIRALAEAPPPASSPRRALLVAFAASVPAIGLLFVLTLGARPDLTSLLGTSWRFTLKLTVVLALAGLALDGVLRLANPVQRASATAWRLLPALLLLAGGIAVELWLLPSAEIGPRMIGKSAFACVVAIPLFSLVPLVAFLYAMREGAPSSATATGALIGVLSASLGAAFYALHCTDDSPLFVALWYILAIAIVAAAGALLGRLVLRW